MSKLKKDHVLGAGGSALAGGAVGAVVGGLVAGPAGIALGAVAGTAVGAVAGHKLFEAADTRGDLGHFEQIYQTMPYYISEMTWDDYAPAYRFGLDTHATHGGVPIEQGRTALESQWERAKGASRLLWSEAEPAVAHAWNELDRSSRAPQA